VAAGWRLAAKRALARSLRQPWVNAALRFVVRPLSRFLPLTTLARLPVVGRVRVALSDGRVLTLDSDGRDVLASGLYWRGLEGCEPETLEAWSRLLPHAQVVFDVGANVGVFALAAAVGAPARRVYAFEPIPETCERLAANLSANGLTNVALVAAAAADFDGEIEVYIPPGVSHPLGASTLATFRAPGTRIRVPAERLDGFASRMGIARVDLIKIDTEGTEPSVLAGAREILARDQPLIVCEVLWGLTEQALHTQLDPLGYRYFQITRAGFVARERIAGDEQYLERNYLFATDRRLADVERSWIVR
jgi:FkbM family methyltransferase